MPDTRGSAIPDPSEARGALDALCERFGLADLYVFGSRAAEIAARVRGTVSVPCGDASGGSATLSVLPAADHADADIDIGIRPRSGIRLAVEEIADLTAALETLFDARRVDLVLLPAASPFLALEVIRGELLYCLDPDDQAEHELYILRRAGDLAPFQRARQEMVVSRGVEP